MSTNGRTGLKPLPGMASALWPVKVPEFRSRWRQTFCEKLKAQEPSFVTNLQDPGRGPSNVCTGPRVSVKLAKVFKIN